MLSLTTLFSKAVHGAAAEEIDRRRLNASSNGHRSTGLEAARRFAPGSSGTGWRRPIPCRESEYRRSRPEAIAFGLAVGAWRVGPGANVLELEDAAGFGKGLGDVGRSVVAHHLTTLDAMTVEPGQCPS